MLTSEAKPKRADKARSAVLRSSKSPASRVVAEDFLHGSADLSDRCVRTHGLEDRIHSVLIAGARLLELLKASFYEVVVPIILQILEAFDLTLRDFGVDAV